MRGWQRPSGGGSAPNRAQAGDTPRPVVARAGPAVAGTAAAVGALAGSAGNAAVVRLLVVQRSGWIQDAETQLRAVQGNAMYGLLPELAAMPPSVLNEQAAARRVGGERLVLAIEAVQARKRQENWIEFAHQRSGRLAGLPVDQITDVIRHLGAPPDARYYPRQLFNQRYDGVVDPVRGEVLLVFKVRFYFEESDRVNVAPLRAGFPSGFKRAVEEVWSGKGACRLPGRDGVQRQFATRVRVEVTAGDPHHTFRVSVIPKGRVSFVDPDTPNGGLDYHDNEPRRYKQDFPAPGGKTVRTETEQITSAHEAGHAFGLAHANGTGNDSTDYAARPEQAPDIMGLGNRVMVQTDPKGQVTHNDFAPFEAIADRWREEMHPGALEAQCR